MRDRAENMRCILPHHDQMYSPLDGAITTEELTSEDIIKIRNTAQIEFNNTGFLSGLKHRLTPRRQIPYTLEDKIFSSVAPAQIMQPRYEPSHEISEAV